MAPQGAAPVRVIDVRLHPRALADSVGFRRSFSRSRTTRKWAHSRASVMFQHLCRRLQPTICFLRDPIPMHPTESLAVLLPLGRMDGLTTFP